MIRDVIEIAKSTYLMVENSYVYNICLFHILPDLFYLSMKLTIVSTNNFFQDATAIKKTIHTKKAEIDHTLMGAKSSKRLK